jgi:hypothetical protein
MDVRKNFERLRNVTGTGLFVSGVLCGCSGGSSSPGGTCGALAFAPHVRLLYPISHSMGIPNNTGVVIYQTYPNGSFGAATSVPIFLGTGPLSSAEATIGSVPTTVPSPLPSSTAVPYPTSSPAIYAAAIPTLSPGVTYSVFAQQSVLGCISTPVFANNSIGSFTTALPP